MPFVLDASAALPWCFKDEQTDAGQELLIRARDGDLIVVPDHWAVEVLNALLQGLKRGRVRRIDVDAFWTDLANLRVRIDRQSLASSFKLFDLAALHKLTAYDAGYLELALRRGLPLATLDADLANAAAAEGVALLL